MPLTPRFELTQDDTQVVVQISVPTVRITNIEVLLEESTLHFYAAPYLLKLDFSPNQFAEDAQGIVSAKYDPSLQTITIPLVKAQPGTTWPNLDLTARLLQPREIPESHSTGWLKSVISSPNEEGGKEASQDDDVDTQEKSSISILDQGPGYGFAGMFQNIFTDYCRSGIAFEMLHLQDPEHTPVAERCRLRKDKEDEDFSEERYQQDLYIEEDYLYPLVMEFRPFWVSGSSEEVFSPDDRLLLATIPYPLIPRSLLPTGNMELDCPRWLGLLDLLVPFVYDHVSTMGDPTVESAWTITILSSSLTWLDAPDEVDPVAGLQQLFINSSRRMLSYPYWRNWQFCCHVWELTLQLLKRGIRPIVRALLKSRSIIEKSDTYYVGNKIFFDPYLYWIQQVDTNDFPPVLIRALEDILRNSSEIKAKVGFNLDALEEQLGHDEEDELDSTDSDDDDDDDDESDDDSDDDSDDSSCEGKEEVETKKIESLEVPNIQSLNLLDEQVGNGPNQLFQIANESIQADNTSSQASEKPKPSRPLIQEL